MKPVTKDLVAYIGTAFGPYIFTFNQTKSIPLGTVSVNATTDVLTLAAHGLDSGDQVRFTTTAILPTPLNVGVYYYVISPTTDTFKLSLTLGGSAINLDDVGSGVHTVVKRGVPIDLTGWHVRAWAKHAISCDDSVWLDLAPTILDAANGRIQFSLADSITLLWKPDDLVYSIILEDTTDTWLGPFVVGKLTIRDTPTDSGSGPPTPTP